MDARILAIFGSLILIMLPIIVACEDNNSVNMDTKFVSDTKRMDRCQNGAVCKEDSNCFDGICRQGICKCEGIGLCRNDDECGEERCCNIMNGTCYDCIKDAWAGSEDGISDDVENDITDMLDDIRDSSTGWCETDLNCGEGGNPYCDPQRKICVECFEDEHCKLGKCDIDSGRCMDLIEDSGVDVISDVLSDVSLDIGGDLLADVSNPCFDYICLCGTICVVESGNPLCKNGCRTNNDCCPNTICDNGQCKKTICTDDIDCNDPSKPHCEIVSGVCYECTNDLHCEANYYCDSNKVCKYKVDACYGRCKSDEWCNSSTSLCERIPSSWCVTCSEVLDPVCIVEGLSCGLVTKKCTKQCNDDNECYGYTCNLFGWCTCP